MRKFLIPALLMLCSSSTPALASQWAVLGKEKVNFNVERDDIRLASKGFLREVAVEVRGAAVYIDTIDVYLGNGKVINLPVRRVVNPRERTRSIHLPGTASIVRKVSVVYKRVGTNLTKAEMVLWGR